MKSYAVTKSAIAGHCHIPPSKSQSIRAILFASMAEGKSEISNYLVSPDIDAMIAACRQLGANIQKSTEKLLITGVNQCVQTPNNIIDAGNSGQVLRFIACLAGLQSHYMVITGDASIRHNRPVDPLIEALPQLGVICESLRGDAHAPLVLKGPFSGNKTCLKGDDSQPVSGLLMAAALREEVTTIKVRDPGEKPWIDLTLHWLDRLGVPYKNRDYQHYQVIGGGPIRGFNYRVPGDLSSLSFPLVAALITGSELVIHSVDMREPQGDKAIVNLLSAMGANITVDPSMGTLTIYDCRALYGRCIDVNDFIDCVPILAVLACYIRGVTYISGAEVARKKESDRITAITQELRKMGADIKELPGGMVIRESNLVGATVESHHDHRIAMSLAIAAMGASGKTVIRDVECIDKSYPGFIETFQSLGAAITVER